MAPQPPLREQEARQLGLTSCRSPTPIRRCSTASAPRARSSSHRMFEFSGACAGCGETPYIKLLTQLYGDRLMIANATGCSSIYGGNLPTTPYATRFDGRGPAWSNSLFEDNAEFGLGMRLTVDKLAELCPRAARPDRSKDGLQDLAEAILPADLGSAGGHRGPAGPRGRAQGTTLAKSDDAGGPATAQPGRLPGAQERSGSSAATAGPTTLATAGWTTCWPPAAMSTCWCWTPGCTPTPAARCPRPPRGRRWPSSPPPARTCRKKDLGAIAMSYGNIYVAQVAYGANMTQTGEGVPRGRGLRRAVA